mgnify:FL=1
MDYSTIASDGVEVGDSFCVEVGASDYAIKEKTIVSMKVWSK